MLTQPTIPIRVRFRDELADSLDRAVRRLRAHPYSPRFIRADVSFEMPRIFNAYSGDISGRYIEFFSIYGQMGYAVDDLAELVRQVLAYQHPAGYFGVAGFNRAKLSDTETKIFWGNGRLLIGLLEYYRWSKDPVVLAAAQKLGDFLFACGLHESTSAIGQAVAADGGPAGFATTFCSCLEGVVRLFEETRDPRYAQLARGIAALLPAKLDGFHSHGRMSALRGMVDLALATDDQALLDNVLQQWQTIHDQHVTVFGGIREHFGCACTRDEGCSIADWLMLSLKLFAATEKAACLDAAEWCLFNHLLANQFHNGGFGHRPFTLDKVTGHDTAIATGLQPGGTEAYWCCSLHGPRALLEASKYLATRRSAASLDVNYLAAADLADGDLSLEISTDALAQTTQIKVKQAPATPVAIRVRIPAWAHEPTASLVHDAGQHAAMEDGYLTMKRRWQPGEVFRVELHPQFEIRNGVEDAVQQTYAPDKQALFYGRLLLGYNGFDDLLWGQSMKADTTTLLLPQARPHTGPVSFPYKTIVEYFDKTQSRTIWAVRQLVPLTLRLPDQPLRTVHTIAPRSWASLTSAQQDELIHG